jgi:long-chain-fatty-acid---luciferin-component ligase
LLPPRDIDNRIKKVYERLARYIPPRETWTPAEEALFNSTDPLRVPLGEARTTQLKAIKYTFSHHYALNPFYRKYSDTRGVTPDDIKTYDDLEKIPLLPDLTFKQHPSGVEFAHWIASVYTGELPTVVIDAPDPTFDDIINAFNAVGLAVFLSAGTSGRHTVIPRDARTYSICEYGASKTALYMLGDGFLADHSLALSPNPAQSNLWVAKGPAFVSDLCEDTFHGLDFQITADSAIEHMSKNGQNKNVPLSPQVRAQKISENAIKWFERYDKTTDTISMAAFPFLLLEIMDALEREGKSFEFGERGAVLTGGGWKISEEKRISPADFWKRVEEMLGIPETRCFDMYGMVEMNMAVFTCSEGHYFHVPYTWLKPLVLDKGLAPAGYDEWGRFAFLDGLAWSYPGFIMTGDEARMLEHCPVCDRPGPVLEPEVKRAPSEEVRGCAEELRRLLASDLEGKK